MKLTVLGSGTCVPSIKRNSPGYCLEAGGTHVLIDCGGGTLLQLERSGRSYRDIDAVFVSHAHPDHFADLMPLIQALLAAPDFKREKDLTVIGHEKFLLYYEKAIATVLGIPGDFTVQLVKAEEKFGFGPLDIFTAKTVHSADSLAFRFEYNNKSIVFTGDTDYDQGIIDLSQNADILIADCSFPNSMKTKGHLSAGECGLVAEKAGAKKILLSHIYPSDSPDIGRIKECRKHFDGEVLLAEDLMELEL
jgi:ribonuclease BN (tRNA processing enzyme)